MNVVWPFHSGSIRWRRLYTVVCREVFLINSRLCEGKNTQVITQKATDQKSAAFFIIEDGYYWLSRGMLLRAMSR
jgi:hypothetical protein